MLCALICAASCCAVARALTTASGFDAAREAFKHGDLEASRAAHAQQEAHQTEEGAYAKSVIFGALDGMLTGFAVVCATDGGGLSWEVVPTVGVASVLAGAISMGVGEYLGSIAETEHAHEERIPFLPHPIPLPIA